MSPGDCGQCGVCIAPLTNSDFCFSVSLILIVPPSLYALSRGGVKSSATIADCFDVGGFSLLAIFNGYVAGITHSKPSAWIPTFTITTACSSIALVAVSLAVFLEGRRGSSTPTDQNASQANKT